MKIHITKGNKKLPTTMLNFSLPPELSCPGATEECKKYCYAKKAYRQYPATKTAWDENMVMSKDMKFVENITDFIKNQRKWESFRIHTSGDFYCQRYLNKWFKIAKEYPTKIFYAYTKSTMLDFTKRPSNFIVLLSDDNKQFKSIWKLFDGVAVVSKTKVDKVDDWFVCPYPEKTCRDCNYCYTKTKKAKRLIFNIH